MGWLFVKLLIKCEVVGVRDFEKCIVVDGGCVYFRLGKGLFSWRMEHRHWHFVLQIKPNSNIE